MYNYIKLIKTRGGDTVKEIIGVSASPGLALGRVKKISKSYKIAGRIVSSAELEEEMFRESIIIAKDDITALVDCVASDEGEIFMFQREILSDAGLLDAILKYIKLGYAAADSVEKAADIYAEKLSVIPDEYFAQRAGDVIDACGRVVEILDGHPRKKIMLDSKVILIAEELMASDLAGANKEFIIGIAMAAGSVQSHCSIIARTYGIPTIVLAGEELLKIKDEEVCALNATEGVIIASPDQATMGRYSHLKGLAGRKSFLEGQLKHTPCVSKDSVPVKLYANCGAPADIAAAIEAGAEGVGLLRSEFLFMEGKVPDEETQFRFYRDCILAAQGRQVTIRTIDIGADKEVSGLTLHEDNPALGMRGIRLCFAKPEIFKTQLSALMRAGVYGNLRIMFPLVTTLDDMENALIILEQVKDELTNSGVDFAKAVAIGCMIETPSAVLIAAELAEISDFFSIGTNDLTQYTLAADRLNTAVSGYFNCESLAIQRLIEMTVLAANKAGISVSICGESASNPQTALIYARLGIKRLSMATVAINEVKQYINDAVVYPV